MSNQQLTTGTLVEERDFFKIELGKVKDREEVKEMKFKSESEQFKKRVAYLEREVVKKEQACQEKDEKLYKQEAQTMELVEEKEKMKIRI